jgi:hypothetical protein
LLIAGGMWPSGIMGTALKNAVENTNKSDKQISKRPAGLLRIKPSTRIRMAKIEALSRQIDKIEANINRAEAQIRRAEGHE